VPLRKSTYGTVSEENVAKKPRRIVFPTLVT
jgi:hypothetical protein